MRALLGTAAHFYKEVVLKQGVTGTRGLLQLEAVGGAPTFGFRISGVGFRISGFGLQISGSGTE